MTRKQVGRLRRPAAPAVRRGDPPSRGGPAAIPELRALRHHVARPARRPRRPQAGPAPDPLRDVPEPPPDAGREVQEVRVGRGRRHRQVPPARRRRDLRRDGPHGAAVLAARPARGRARQLRLSRRRLGRRVPVHGSAPQAARDRAPLRDPEEDRRLAPELRRRALRARRPAGALPEPPRERRDGHRGRHGDVHPAAQPGRGPRRGHRGRGRPRRRSAQDDQGPGLPDGRAPPRRQARDARALRDRPGHAQAARRVGGRGGAARRPDDRGHVDPVRAGKGRARLENRRRHHRAPPPRPRGRARRVDGRRADRPRDQARHGSRARHDLPLQAHAARDDGAGEPHVPRPDGEPGRLRAGTPLAQGDAPALPRLPLRDREAAVHVRPRGAAAAASTSSRGSSSSTTLSTRRSASSASRTARRTRPGSS